MAPRGSFKRQHCLLIIGWNQLPASRHFYEQSWKKRLFLSFYFDFSEFSILKYLMQIQLAMMLLSAACKTMRSGFNFTQVRLMDSPMGTFQLISMLWIGIRRTLCAFLFRWWRLQCVIRCPTSKEPVFWKGQISNNKIRRFTGFTSALAKSVMVQNVLK